MPHYRLYFMDGAGSIASVEAFSATDDGEAIRISRDGCGPHRTAELWCRERPVGTLGSRENALRAPPPP